MFYSILAQVKHNLKTRKCKAVFAVILGFVLANYLQNVFRYAGYDVIDMYHPMKLRLLVATDNPLGFYFMQLFPFLAVIPASFVLLENRETRYEIYICSRIGKQRYHFSATISAALTTFVVFFLPFLLEIALNVLAFPLQAFGDPSNLSCYDPLYLKIVSRYFWPSLYVKMPYLYAVLNVVVVSLTSAVIGLLPFAIGGFLKGKYKLVLFLPTYLLFYVLQIWGGSVPGEFSTSYFDYLMFYDGTLKNYAAFVVFLLSMLIFSLTAVAVLSKSDICN